MKQLFAIVWAVAVNAAFLGLLQHASYVPKGEVYITELTNSPMPVQLAALDVRGPQEASLRYAADP